MRYELEGVQAVEEDLTLSKNDVKEIIEVRNNVLNCLLTRQNNVDKDGVVWAELEGMIDCITNMYDPSSFLDEGSDKWH